METGIKSSAIIQRKIIFARKNLILTGFTKYDKIIGSISTNGRNK